MLYSVCNIPLPYSRLKDIESLCSSNLLCFLNACVINIEKFKDCQQAFVPQKHFCTGLRKSCFKTVICRLERV